MAVDPGPGDPTWSGLSTAAGDGQLLLESGAAELCAQRVEDMLGVVLGVRNWVQQNVALASPVIADPLVSAELLRTVFATKIGTEFVDRLNQHQVILTNMGQTFVAAGKKYQQTEDDSTERFQHISFDDPSPVPPSGAPPKGEVPTNPGLPDSVTEYDSFAFGPELGAQLAWQTLYWIGRSINPQAVADAGAVWHWLSETLDTGFRTLQSDISSVTDKWIGQGSQAAIGATDLYVGTSQLLTQDMNQLGELLVYTSGWLGQTKAGMPPVPEPPPATTVEQQQLNEIELAGYQNHFQTHYATNFTQVTSRVVVLPQPDQVRAQTGGVLNSDPVLLETPVTAFTEEDPLGDPALDDPGDGSSTVGGGDDILDGTEGSDGSEGGGGSGGSGGGSDPTLPETLPPGETPPPGTDPAGGLPRPDPSALTPPDLLDAPRGLPPDTPLTVTPTPMLAGATPLGSGGPSGSGARPSGLGVHPAPRLLLDDKAKLFPRASPLPPAEPLGRAGPGNGRGGYPIGPGVPGAVRDEEKERKKSEYLNSTEHLDEAIGDPGRGVRPVLDR